MIRSPISSPIKSPIQSAVRGRSSVVPVAFDGSTYAERDAGLTGASDGTGFTVLVLGNITLDAGTSTNFFNSNPTRLTVLRGGADTFAVILKNTAGATIWVALCGSTWLPADGTIQHIASVDTSNTSGTEQIYRNGVSDFSANTAVNGTIDWTLTDHSAGASVGGATAFAGSILLALWDTRIDLSVADNLAKFWRKGLPVDIGRDGLGPGLGAPLVYFRGPVGAAPDTTLINYGAGGNFNVKAGELLTGARIETF